MAASCKDDESEGVNYRRHNKLGKPNCKRDILCRISQHPLKYIAVVVFLAFQIGSGVGVREKK